MKKIVLLAAALLLAVASFAQSEYNYQKRSLFEQLPIRGNDIVFLGNSITDGGEWAELFNNRHVKNRGISADRSGWLLDRLDPIINGHPKKLFLMIGTNDLAVGIAPEELNHVWERYYRASSNMVRASEGSGLGLSIVKEILSLHKSNFGVDSTVGNGTTFWFELNFVKAEKMRNVLSSPEASPEERNK